MRTNYDSHVGKLLLTFSKSVSTVSPCRGAYYYGMYYITHLRIFRTQTDIIIILHRTQ